MKRKQQSWGWRSPATGCSMGMIHSGHPISMTSTWTRLSSPMKLTWHSIQHGFEPWLMPFRGTILHQPRYSCFGGLSPAISRGTDVITRVAQSPQGTSNHQDGLRWWDESGPDRVFDGPTSNTYATKGEVSDHGTLPEFIQDDNRDEDFLSFESFP